LLGIFQANTYAAFFATTGVVLGAAYMLMLYRRVVFGPQDNQDATEMSDLNTLEKAILLPLVILVFYLGVFPNVVLEKVSPAVTSLVVTYQERAITAEEVLENSSDLIEIKTNTQEGIQ
jgi:NADH-quinone oxidoreductase subunit M